VFLLDTNVVSELRRPKPDTRVSGWFSATITTDLYISVVTVMELEIGVRRMERRDGDQGRRLRSWLEDQVREAFDGRILPVDLDIARQAAVLQVPNPRPHLDALIAATAKVRGFSVVTRNTADFQSTGIDIVDPWA